MHMARDLAVCDPVRMSVLAGAAVLHDDGDFDVPARHTAFVFG